MMNEAATTWPAGYGYVPGLPINSLAQERRRPDRRYQRAFAFLISHPKWVNGNLPQTMVVQAMREKFRLCRADSEAVIDDVRESLALGMGIEDLKAVAAEEQVDA